MLGSTVLIPSLVIPAMGGSQQGRPILQASPPAPLPPAAQRRRAPKDLRRSGMVMCFACWLTPCLLRAWLSWHRRQPPANCLCTSADLANVICTLFFVSGLITLIQTFVGDRLPIIQGGRWAGPAEVRGGAAGAWELDFFSHSSTAHTCLAAMGQCESTG